MKKTTILLALLMSVNMIGQQLKKKKNSEYFYEETYTVDKSSKMRHGNYLKVSEYSGDTLVVGQYDQDKKVGLWSFKGADNSPYMTYDYNDNKIVEIKDKSYGKASIQVKAADKFEMTSVDHPAIFLGFHNEIQRTFIATLKAPPSVYSDAKSGMVMTSFDIDEKGVLQNFNIVSSYDNNLNKALGKAVENIKTGWLPASINGAPVVSKMHMMFNFSFIMGRVKPVKSKLLERPDLIVVDIVYYGTAN